MAPIHEKNRPKKGANKTVITKGGGKNDAVFAALYTSALAVLGQGHSRPSPIRVVSISYLALTGVTAQPVG